MPGFWLARFMSLCITDYGRLLMLKIAVLCHHAGCASAAVNRFWLTHGLPLRPGGRRTQGRFVS